MRVKVREKVSADTVASLGKRKAMFRTLNESGRIVTVSVAQYKGVDYFLVEYDNTPKECMPMKGNKYERYYL